MLKQLNKSMFDEVYKILKDSFPPDELRSKQGQLALLERTDYKLFGTFLQSKLIAVMAVYELDGFVFLEHFAVSKKARGTGVGSVMLRELRQAYNCPICFEVELPTDEETARRIEFYRHRGFYLNGFHYIMPALEADKNPIPMLLMRNRAPMQKSEFLQYKEKIYRDVYGFDG